jgi:hypothetical protein
MTNAMPVLDGKLRNSSIAASNPPAEPPMPTIGQFKFLLSGFAFDFVLARLNRGNFVLLAFFCERDAFVLAFRFAMALLMLVTSQTSYKLRFPSWRRTWAGALYSAVAAVSDRRKNRQKCGSQRAQLSSAGSTSGQSLRSSGRRSRGVQAFLDQIAFNLPVFER